MAQNLANTVAYRNAVRHAKKRAEATQAAAPAPVEKKRVPLPGEGDLFTTVSFEDHDEWLDIRGAGVGGSDVAAIIGVSPFKTIQQLWCEKTGKVPAQDISENPIVKFGSEYEETVRGWYAACHPDLTVFSPGVTCKSVERPWAQANLDAVVLRPDGTPEVLEIKTARDAAKWKEGVPDYYLAQVRHYQAVTGWGDAHVAVFFRDSCQYREFDVPRDEEAIAAQEAAVDYFWQHNVMEHVQPDEFAGADISIIHALHPKGEGFRDCTKDGQAVRLVDTFVNAKAAESAAKEARAAAQAALESFIGDDKGLTIGNQSIIWYRSTTNRLDTQALREKYPEVYEECMETQARNGGIRVKGER